jgi:hypothetical protein
MALIKVVPDVRPGADGNAVVIVPRDHLRPGHLGNTPGSPEHWQFYGYVHVRNHPEHGIAVIVTPPPHPDEPEYVAHQDAYWTVLGPVLFAWVFDGTSFDEGRELALGPDATNPLMDVVEFLLNVPSRRQVSVGT